MEISIQNTRPVDAPKQEIKHKVDMKKNIFAHLLKKTDNKFLKEALEESKKIKEITNTVMGHKMDELTKLRENILQLTPKTVSSHGSDLEGLTDLDFNNPDAYKIAQEKLEAKQKKRAEEKAKKIEEERQQKEGLIK